MTPLPSTFHAPDACGTRSAASTADAPRVQKYPGPAIDEGSNAQLSDLTGGSWQHIYVMTDFDNIAIEAAYLRAEWRTT